MADARKPYRFRVWDSTEKRMLYEPAFETGDRVDLNHLLQDPRWHFMMDTGWLDKNKKPIYEGDLCRIVHKTEFGLARVIGEVMRTPAGCLDIGTKIPSDVKVDPNLSETPEVMGNIWENPELMQ